MITVVAWDIFGGIAQLGERLNGIQEVSGSIPLISTKKAHRTVCFFLLFLCIKMLLGNVISTERYVDRFLRARFALPQTANRM